MEFIEVEARSVDEAISEALAKLQAERDEVEVTVLEEGTKGFFGILGGKMARVRVEKKKPLHEAKLERAIEFTTELLRHMDISARVVGEADEEAVNIRIEGDDLGILIGRKGQTLQSMQYLISLAVNRQDGEWMRINLDIGDYRVRREESLRALAHRAARRVQDSGRRVALGAMTAAERRIVHQAVNEYDGVTTQSEGQEPYRRVVILPE
ncbi:MAG: RNA-binding cell elongation regulator Jag/EloR [Limnochordia bacterium]|jgi:spoIIIJ-associated protein|nr:protein jag [Bacillota bacterium]